MRVFVLIIASLIISAAYFAYRILDVPYEVTIPSEKIPVFTPAYFEHTHHYKDSKSWPIVGGAAFDLDNDQQPELFIGGGFYQQDAIYKYEDGVFNNITQSIGLIKDFGDTSYGAASLDVNNDGYSDLFIARDSGIYLYLNKQGFLQKTKLDIPFAKHSVPISITLGDINQDNHVDMFVSCYISRAKFETYTHFNKKNYGATSLLLINNGNNTFRVAGKTAEFNKQKNTLSAIFADFDKDRKLDLAIAYEAGQIDIYKNNGKLSFEKIHNPSNDYYGYPMGIAAGDYDNNGYIDIFSANIGTSVPAFLGKGDLKGKQILNRKWILLQNNGGFDFENVAENRKIANYEFGRGAVMADVSLDGLQDIIVATNFNHYLPHHLYKTPGKLLVQTNLGEFAPVQGIAKVNNRAFASTPIVADFNNDGFPDIVYLNAGAESKAYFNNGGGNHYIKVILEDRAQSIGATVTLTTGKGLKRSEQLIIGEGLAADQSHQILFGLAFETSVNQIDIEYLSGRKVTINTPRINETILLNEHTKSEPDKVSDDTAKPLLDDKWSEPDIKETPTVELD